MAPRTAVREAASEEATMEWIEPVLIAFSYLVVFAWPAVAIPFILRGLVSYVRFALRLCHAPIIDDQIIVDRLLRACDKVGVGRRPRLKEVGCLSAPAVFGLFRPVICLPSDWQNQLTGQRLDWVLRHELAHIKCRDGWVLFVAGLAKSLHWFHPISWIAFAKLQTNIERVADEVATRDLGESGIREYGNLLLQYAASQTTARQSATVGLLAMALPRGLPGRIESLTTPRPKRRWLVRMTMIPIVGFVALSGLTDAKTAQTSIDPPRHIPDVETFLSEVRLPLRNELQLKPPETEPVRMVSIDVENALRKAEEIQPGIDADSFVLTYFGYRQPVTAQQRAETEIVDGIMTTFLTPQHETLTKQMLAEFERSGLWQIVVELRTIETDVRMLDQFDWSAEDKTTRCSRPIELPSVDDQGEWEATFAMDVSTFKEIQAVPVGAEQSVSIPVRATTITRLQSELLLHQLQQDSRSSTTPAPKVTLFNGQCVIFSDVAQRPFVTDVSVVRGDVVSALQPKISVFEEGVKFRLKTRVTEDEKVDLQMVFTQSTIDGVRLASLPRLAANQPEGEVTIQVPSVRTDSIAVQSRLGSEEALLVFSPKPYASEQMDQRQSDDSGKCQVFMIRTLLLSDKDFLAGFMPSIPDGK